jgi:pyruvate,water dikinase
MSGYYQWRIWNYEKADVHRHKVWVLDSKETLNSVSFLDLLLMHYMVDSLPYGAAYFQVPTSKGADFRLKDGWMYVSVNATTEEERQKREPEFRKRIAPWIEDYGKEYHKLVDMLNEEAEKIKSVDLAKATDGELKRVFQDFLDYYVRATQTHFVWLYGYCIVYRLFEDICKDMLNIDKYDRLFNDLMAGFDHKLLQSDRKQFRLGKLAVDLGLQALFQSTSDDHELIRKLGEEGERGKKWLGELRKFVDEYGWRMGGIWDMASPSWVEDPSLAIPAIRTFMTQPTFAVDEHRGKLEKARGDAEKEIVSRVPEDAREWFAKLMRAAQWAAVVNEEHTFYIENYSNAVARSIFKEIGKRFAEAGIIDEPTDICYMLPEEISIRIIPKFDAHKIVSIRKQQHKKFRKVDNPHFIGDPNAVAETMAVDPVVSSTITPVPRVRPELKADIYGTIAAPGIAEGIAHVIMSQTEIPEFKAGEILVTTESASAWTPLFGIAKAVITDMGGYLSHAAIVGREFGLPVIAGTMEATKKIKTGMRLRVDGDLGVVYILQK